MEKRNIILVTLDGFRKDKIDLCPFLKSVKEDNIFFSNMMTVAPYTFASHHAIFSGMYPSRNGLNGYYNLYKFKKNEITTLAQALQKEGYYTVSETLNEVVLPRQGFDEYNLFDESNVNLQERHKELIQRISKKDKFFVFLHYTDAHAHYVRDIISKYEKEGNDDEYFKSIKENNEKFNATLPACDEYVSMIINTLKESGISEKTMVLFISDHGTSVGEKKGEKFYGVFVYDYTINVFCILKKPDSISKIINKQCSTLDLFPTIAEYAGVVLDENFEKIQGESLFKLIDDESSSEREVFVETGGLYGPWPSPERHNVFCVRIENKKLIYNDEPETWEFYDLLNDPEEKQNIYDEKSEYIKKFKQRLIFYLNENEIETKIS